MSPKKWSKNTFGWARAEVLGALVNAVFLVAICFSITIEACKRFIEKEPIHEPKLLVVVGVIGLLINVVGLVLLFGKSAQGSLLCPRESLINTLFPRFRARRPPRTLARTDEEPQQTGATGRYRRGRGW